MATYEKRTARDGATYYRIRIRGRWQSFKPSTMAAARRWATEREAAIRSGRESASGADFPFTRAVERYLTSELSRLADSEQPNRRRHLDWWSSRLGALPVREVTRALVDDELRGLTRLTPATRNRYRAALSAVLSAAVEWEWLAVNPLHRHSRRKRPKGDRERERERVLDAEERERLFAECRRSAVPSLYPLVACAYASGARQGELLGIQWGDLRWPANGAVFAEVVDTKNGDARVIYFPGVGGEALRELARTPRMSRYVFARHVDGTRRPGFPAMGWRRALERAGIRDLRFHDLRHCWACNLLDSGATLPQLMILGGWRSPAMVRRYASRAQRHGSEAVEALGRLMDLR